MATSPSPLSVIEALQSSGVNMAELFFTLLESKALQTSRAIRELSEGIIPILSALLDHPVLGDAVTEWTYMTTKKNISKSIKALTKKENGWHFSALRATPERLADFQLEEMAEDIQELAPDVWELIGYMLGGQEMAAPAYISKDIDDDERELWECEDDVGLLTDGNLTLDAGGQRQVVWQARRQALIRIKQVVVISIMMQSMNQQCNALQCILGVFLHSCNTPEKVVKTLARAGVSISHDAINRAVKSLSAESTKAIVELGQTLLTSYAYDNFDVQLHIGTPTVEDGLSDNLLHLTSGDLLRLEHGVTTDDLKCSEELWKNSPYNTDPASPPYPAHISLKSTDHLRALHPEHNHPSGIPRRRRFNAWQFLYDLCQHGPEYFHQFRKELGEPDEVEKIPVKKLYHVPARAMDINQSTASGNKDAIANLLAQGGVGDPNEDDDSGYQNDVVDMTDYVVLVHGDLSTYERVQSVMERRAAEATPWRRFQYVVFVMGLFHLKMAAADAMWRIFIAQSDAQKDENALMGFVSILRANETGKIGSKPKFRQMHEVIRHTGVALRLDAWRAMVSKRDKNMKTLEDYAASKPSLNDLKTLSLTLATNFVAGQSFDIFLARCKSSAERDEQLENTALLHQYVLLYEELTYAMNAGDIGRVETLFPPWIAIFRATGKHKYATQMIQFLTDVHYRYPEGLRHAIRYNILVNPTGRPFAFRAVDWIVELNNLFTKFIYGGSGSNYTKDRIITESPLIQIYRNCHSNVEKNFRLGGLSSAHAAKDMRQTFKKLCTYMRDNQTNEYKRSRSTAYEIVDMLEKGLSMEDGVPDDDDEFDWDEIDDILDAITVDDLDADVLFA